MIGSRGKTHTPQTTKNRNKRQEIEESIKMKEIIKGIKGIKEGNSMRWLIITGECKNNNSNRQARKADGTILLLPIKRKKGIKIEKGIEKGIEKWIEKEKEKEKKKDKEEEEIDKDLTPVIKIKDRGPDQRMIHIKMNKFITTLQRSIRIIETIC